MRKIKKRPKRKMRQKMERTESIENRFSIYFQAWDSILKALKPQKEPKGGYVRSSEYDHW